MSIGGGTIVDLEYPLNNPSYHPAFDDGNFCLRELKVETRNWRAEKYATVSKVWILDRYDHGCSIGYRNDREIDELLAATDAKQPRIRFILLEPTPQERLLHTAQSQPGTMQHVNELFELTDLDPIRDSQEPEQEETRSQLNITHSSLISILSRYHIPEKVASHIRGQEQVFGSQPTYVKDGDHERLKAYDFWYAIRARASFNELNYRKEHKEADLKVTVVTHYEPQTQKSVVILKYRGFNDLATSLQKELKSRLRQFVEDDNATKGFNNPVGLALFHFGPVIQYYRRGARDPRDTIRKQEEIAHQPRERARGFQEIDIKALHLTLGSLDQNIVQLKFLLDLIKRLRSMHESLNTDLAEMRSTQGTYDKCLSRRVEHELERFESHIAYIRDGQKESARKAHRLMDLEFRISTRYQATATTKMAEHAMQDSISMKNIAIVTMIFLPVTAVASVLGTNLVAGPTRPDDGSGSSPGDTQLLWSGQWWILPAVAVPLTLITFWVWSIRQGRVFERNKARLDAELGLGPAKL